VLADTAGFAGVFDGEFKFAGDAVAERKVGAGIEDEVVWALAVEVDFDEDAVIDLGEGHRESRVAGGELRGRRRETEGGEGEEAKGDSYWSQLEE